MPCASGSARQARLRLPARRRTKGHHVICLDADRFPLIAAAAYDVARNATLAELAEQVRIQSSSQPKSSSAATDHFWRRRPNGRCRIPPPCDRRSLPMEAETQRSMTGAAEGRAPLALAHPSSPASGRVERPGPLVGFCVQLVFGQYLFDQMNAKGVATRRREPFR
jgi:hypothetical protein